MKKLKNRKKCMIMLSLFSNLINYFSGELALFHALLSWAYPGRAGRVPDESWACPRRELGVSQTSGGKSRPKILIVNIFFLFLFFGCVCECECDWVFWGSSSLLSSPHLFICKSWGVVVVVGGCGGTDSGTKASPPSPPVFLLSLNVVNEWKSNWLWIGCLGRN